MIRPQKTTMLIAIQPYPQPVTSWSSHIIANPSLPPTAATGLFTGTSVLGRQASTISAGRLCRDGPKSRPGEPKVRASLLGRVSQLAVRRQAVGRHALPEVVPPCARQARPWMRTGRLRSVWDAEMDGPLRDRRR